MKRPLHYYVGMLFLSISIPFAQAQQVPIPDAAFRTYLEGKYPACMSGGNLNTQCQAVLDATSLNIPAGQIADLTGIEHFTGLQSLTCNNNKLTFIPALPASLKSLSLRVNLITEVPALPSDLVTLDLSSNDINTITGFPDYLETINLKDNALPSIPSLTSMLVTLDVGRNQLTALPGLPEGLTSLKADINNLTSLPDLPSTLTFLQIDFNQITNLPDLPTSLSTLNATNNVLSDLPELPASLLFLSITNNNIDCLPTLPDNMADLTADPSIGCLPNLPSNPQFTSSVGTTVCSASNNPNGCILTGLFASVSKADLLQAYPNPSKGALRLSCGMYKNGTLSIANANGKVVYFQDNADFSGIVEVDLSTEQKGLYIIQLVTEKDVLTKKVVLN